MAIVYANSELAVRAWLRNIPGLPTNSIGTTVPQDNSTWAASGFVQIAVTGGSNIGFFSNRGSGGGSPNGYFPYRRPIATAHCWAVNPDSQNPPWGKAADLAETIAHACWNEDLASPGTLSLGVTGAPSVRILQANILTEPERKPSDPAHYAHYTLDFQIFWHEVEA